MANQVYLSYLSTARNIVENELSLEDKIKLLSGRDFWHLESVPPSSTTSLQQRIPPICLTDGPHGLRKQENMKESHNLLQGRVQATCFPTASCMACSWDPALVTQVGVALGKECRLHRVSVLLGPGLNIQRHVCGGRNFEYYSEDPYLSGILARALVEGVQSQGVAACIKHVCANNQEHLRMRVNVVVDERTLREIYLRGFELCVKDAPEPPVAMMCAYNRLNGEYCSEQSKLFREIVRDEWGFQGIVMTDWGATNDRIRALEAGIDLEMPGSCGAYDERIKEEVQDGILSEDTINDSVVRNVALSLMGNEQLSSEKKESPQERSVSEAQEMMEDHHDLARNVAMQSAVLLKNEHQLLPLARNTDIVVYGDLAEKPRYQGMGSSQVRAYKVDCALDRFRYYTASIEFVSSYNDDQLSHDEPNDKKHKVAIVFVGVPEVFESEGMDRSHINLPFEHDAVVEEAKRRHDKVVVVVTHGSPVALPWIDKVQSVLTGHLAGQGGGSGLVDLIFGVMSPCGKLAETFPFTVEDQPCHKNFPGKHDQVAYREGLNVGYRGFDAAKLPVLFPFGHGLSYSHFEYSNMTVSLGHDEAGAQVSVEISNKGSVRAAEVVQCYVRDCESTVYRPEQELKAFQKVWLDPGQTTRIYLALKRDAFAFYDVGIHDWVVEPGIFEIRLGSSSRDIRLTSTVDIINGTQTPSVRAQEAHPAHLSLVASDEEFATMLGVSRLPCPSLHAWPFHHNTLVKEMEHSTMGRMIVNMIRKGTARELPAELQEDEAHLEMVHAVIENLPLRGLVLFSKGAMTFTDLELVLALLNHSYLKTLQLLWPVVKQRVWKSED